MLSFEGGSSRSLYVWRARFGRGFGPVVRQTTKWLKSFKGIADALEYVNVRLLHSNRRHVSATHVAIFRVACTKNVTTKIM
jgi:hypothetical protein